METKGTNDLIQLIDQSGLAKEKTVQLGEQMSKFFNLASEWDDKIEQIVVTDPTQTREMKIARETRLMLRQYRLDAQKLIKNNRDVLKEQMSDQILLDKLYLNAGKMITATFENLETKLEQKEKFAERWENEQKQILRGERLSKLEPFTDNPTIYPVETMSEKQFNELLNGLKAQKEQKEYEAEQQRLRNEQIEFENEMLSRQNALLNAGFVWNGSVFHWENIQITPDQLTQYTTDEFNREFAKMENEIRAIIVQRTIQQQPEPEPEPIKPEPVKIVEPKTQPVFSVDQMEQKFKYIKAVNDLRFEPFFGNMPFEMDLMDKFDGFKKWALGQIENEFK